MYCIQLVLIRLPPRNENLGLMLGVRMIATLYAYETIGLEYR